MEDEEVDIYRGIGEAHVVHTYPYSSLPTLESHVHPKFIIFDAGRKLRTLMIENSDVLKNVIDHYPSLSKVQNLYRAWIQEPPKISLKDKTYINPEFELVYDPEYEDTSGDDPEYKDISGDDLDEPIDSDYGVNDDQTLPGRGDGLYLRPRTRSVAAAEEASAYDGQVKRPPPRTRSVAAEQAGNGDGARGGKTRTSKVPVRKRKVLSESFTNNQQLLSEATLSRFNQQFGEVAWTADRIRQWSSLPKKRRRVVPSYPFL
jgi:hypothetical protein